MNWIKDIIRNDSLNSGGTGEVENASVVFIWAVIVSIFCFGGMIGGLLAGFVSETFGRKWGIILNNLLVFLSALLMGKLDTHAH